MNTLNELSDYVSGMDLINKSKRLRNYEVNSKALLFRDLEIYCCRTFPFLIESVVAYEAISKDNLDYKLVGVALGLRVLEIPINFLKSHAPFEKLS